MSGAGVQGAALRAFDQIMSVSADCARKAPCPPELVSELKTALDRIPIQTAMTEMTAVERAMFCAAAALIENSEMKDAVRLVDYSRRLVLRANVEAKKEIGPVSRNPFHKRKDIFG